jgi:hypothetical protein
MVFVGGYVREFNHGDDSRGRGGRRDSDAGDVRGGSVAPLAATHMANAPGQTAISHRNARCVALTKLSSKKCLMRLRVKSPR